MSSIRYWGKDTDARIAGRAVRLWVRCGRARLLAVVEDEPPEIVCIVSMTPDPEFRIVDGRVENNGRLYRGAFGPASFSLGCRRHGHHTLQCDRIVDAFERGVRNAEVEYFDSPR